MATIFCATGISVGLSQSPTPPSYSLSSPTPTRPPPPTRPHLPFVPPSSPLPPLPPTCPFRNHNDKEKPCLFPDLSAADNLPGFLLPVPTWETGSRVKDALPERTIAVRSVDSTFMPKVSQSFSSVYILAESDQCSISMTYEVFCNVMSCAMLGCS